MEDKKTIFDYTAQVFVVFGISILILNVFCLLFGESAKDISTMFALGRDGLTVAVMLEFLLISILTTLIRFIFFTDILIKKMSVTVRTICMLAAELLIIALFIWLCDWFPVDMWEPWAMFFLCFGICVIISTLITMLKEKAENRHMEEALRQLQREEK